MADTEIALNKVAGINTSAPRAMNAAAYYGEFDGDDTDYHIFRTSTSGKSKFTYLVDNLTNKDCTVDLWGSFAEDSEPGDSGTIQIGGSITASATGAIHDTTADGFPWLLVRCKFADTPDSKVVTVYTYVVPN